MTDAFSVAVCENFGKIKIWRNNSKETEIEKTLTSVEPSGVVFRMMPLNTMTFNCLINSFSVELLFMLHVESRFFCVASLLN